MRTDSVKKYVIPNIPYLFILWACLKLGTAYRLAPGADFAHKLMGLGQSIGPAFADFAPGLAPFDWLIGIVGAVGFRLLIYFKSKNAKKFRRDEEYGSARWGTEKDIKPFVDPKFENNVILTKTEFLSMNTRPKNPANARNLNACIIGSSGSGKTRFWLTPQLLQAHCSYVCVDPKGGVLSQVGAFLQRRGYQVKVFNSIDFSKSMHYNPLSYIHNEADILKFVDTLIANTKGEGKEGDPFWTKAETLLYCALIAYIIFEAPAEDRNINTLVDMISGMDVKEDDESYMNAVDYILQNIFFGVLSFIPFIAMVGGFEYAYQKKAYVYVDGIYLRRNWGGEYENVAVLVAIAVNEDGFREVLGAAEGMKEDKASWVSFFQWLHGRGLDGVKLIVGDKCMGMLEAVGEVFPDAKYQRCTVHFYRNVFSVVPKSKVKIVAKMLKAIQPKDAPRQG